MGWDRDPVQIVGGVLKTSIRVFDINPGLNAA